MQTTDHSRNNRTEPNLFRVLFRPHTIIRKENENKFFKVSLFTFKLCGQEDENNLKGGPKIFNHLNGKTIDENFLSNM